MTEYEIWIKNDPTRIDGFVGDTQCFLLLPMADGSWKTAQRTTDRKLVEWNLRDFRKCNPKIADHYEVREVSHA